MTKVTALNIYLKTLPYDDAHREERKFLVTSVKMKQNGAVIEYWLTLFGDVATSIAAEDIINLVRKLHRRGVYRRTDRVVSFIERTADNDPLDTEYDMQAFLRKDLIAPRHNYNFLI